MPFTNFVSKNYLAKKFFTVAIKNIRIHTEELVLQYYDMKIKKLIFFGFQPKTVKPHFK